MSIHKIQRQTINCKREREEMKRMRMRLGKERGKKTDR
jgi:hypothetical protein